METTDKKPETIHNKTLSQNASDVHIEDLDLLKERFVEMNKLAEIGQLTAGILHEIQNPLNFINNFSKLSIGLVTDIKDIFESQKESTKVEDTETLIFLLDKLESANVKIGENGGRVERIIQSMLAQTRSENKTPQFVATNLNQLLEEFTKLAYQGVRGEDKDGGSAPRFNASFVFNLDPNMGMVNVSKTEISRVVLNLVNNACYAINEKNKKNIEAYVPQIIVSSQRLVDKIEIKIRDNGIGISEETIEKIFLLFFTTKPVGKGTGLGLSLSRDIIMAMHKGNLSVASEIDVFTEFTIQIPTNL
jgi:two-component system, NtrC family, sensor kinase